MVMEALLGNLKKQVKGTPSSLEKSTKLRKDEGKRTMSSNIERLSYGGTVGRPEEPG